MTRLYGTNEWHEDLKDIFKRATVAFDQNIVFLFTDSEVNKSQFLSLLIRTYKNILLH